MNSIISFAEKEHYIKIDCIFKFQRVGLFLREREIKKRLCKQIEEGETGFISLLSFIGSS